MNIFEEYLNKILDKIKLASEEKLILLPESLSGINVDIPPKKFKCDLSTNVAMVLSKTNNESPIKIAEKLKDIIFKDDNNICLLYTSPSPRDLAVSRMPSSA